MKLSSQVGIWSGLTLAAIVDFVYFSVTIARCGALKVDSLFCGFEMVFLGPLLFVLVFFASFSVMGSLEDEKLKKFHKAVMPKVLRTFGAWPYFVFLFFVAFVAVMFSIMIFFLGSGPLDY
jgi:hypothetical protein